MAMCAIQIKVLSLSPTMKEGTIVDWLKVKKTNIWHTYNIYFFLGRLRVHESWGCFGKHPDRQEDEEGWKTVTVAGVSDTFAVANIPVVAAPKSPIGGSTPDLVMPSLSPTMM